MVKKCVRYLESIRPKKARQYRLGDKPTHKNHTQTDTQNDTQGETEKMNADDTLDQLFDDYDGYEEEEKPVAKHEGAKEKTAAENDGAKEKTRDRVCCMFR